MSFDLEFSWASSRPDVTGVVRAKSADFKVVEQSIPPTGEGEHAYLRVSKTDTNTHWVAEKIAEIANVSVNDVGYGGRKDRYSVSEQAFTCYLPGQADPDWTRLNSPEMRVLDVSRTQKKLRKGDLLGNAFELLLTEVSASLDARLAGLETYGVPNYFGEQRFGRQGQNLVMAETLVERPHGRFRQRDMILSAMRAYLFNVYVSNFVSRHRDRVPDYGALGPLYGRSRDPQPGEEWLSEKLATWIATLRQLRIKAGNRKLWLLPLEFTWDRVDNDYALRFALPPGAYATSVLRELLLYKDERRGG